MIIFQKSQSTQLKFFNQTNFCGSVKLPNNSFNKPTKELRVMSWHTNIATEIPTLNVIALESRFAWKLNYCIKLIPLNQVKNILVVLPSSKLRQAVRRIMKNNPTNNKKTNKQRLLFLKPTSWSSWSARRFPWNLRNTTSNNFFEKNLILTKIKNSIFLHKKCANLVQRFGHWNIYNIHTNKYIFMS